MLEYLSSVGFPDVQSTPIAPWAVAIAAIVGWGLTAYFMWQRISNLKAERERILAETIESAGKLLDKTQQARAAHRDACVAVKLEITTLLRLLNEDDTACLEQRNRVCAGIADRVLHEFHGYCEWRKLELRHQPNELEQFILQVVCPELESMAKWIGVCNHPSFINKFGATRFAITGPTVHVYSALVSNLAVADRGEVGRRLSKSVQSLLDS